MNKIRRVTLLGMFPSNGLDREATGERAVWCVALRFATGTPSPGECA
jgi:hypothetical protein